MLIPIFVFIGQAMSLLVLITVMRLLYMTKNNSPLLFLFWMVCVAASASTLTIMMACIDVILLL